MGICHRAGTPMANFVSIEKRGNLKYVFIVIILLLYNCCQGLLSLAPRKWGNIPPMASIFYIKFQALVLRTTHLYYLCGLIIPFKLALKYFYI